MAKQNSKKILIVCSGNSCRSIMAEAYLKKRAKEERLSLKIESAGTLGIEGMPPMNETYKVLAMENIDSKGLISRGLTKELIGWADIILVMERMHKDRIAAMAPSAMDKVLFLKEFDDAGGDVTIPDPIGKPLSFYKASFDIIKRSIEGFIAHLKKE